MRSTAFASTGARPDAGRHAGPRQAQGWLPTGAHAPGRHAQGRHAPDQEAPDRHAPDRQAPDRQVRGPQAPGRHTGARGAGAFARRFAVSVGAADMVAIALPEAG